MVNQSMVENVARAGSQKRDLDDDRRQVWLTTAKGELFSFAQGGKQSLKVSGMLAPFSGSTVVYTTPDLQFCISLSRLNTDLWCWIKQARIKSSLFPRILV